MLPDEAPKNGNEERITPIQSAPSRRVGHIRATIRSSTHSHPMPKVPLMLYRYIIDMTALRPTIRRTPTILLGALGLLAVLGILLVWMTTREEALTFAKETTQLQRTTSAVSDELTMALNDRYGDLALLHRTLSSLHPRTHLDDYFQSFLRSYPMYEWVGLVTTQYDIVASSAPRRIPGDILKDLFGGDSPSTQPFAVIAPDPVHDRRDSLYIRTPVIESARGAGFALAVIPLATVEAFIRHSASFSMNQTASTTMTYALFHSQRPTPVLATHRLASHPFKELQVQISAHATGHGVIPGLVPDTDLVFTYDRILAQITGPTTWYLVMGKTRADLLAAHRQWLQLITLFTALVGVIFLFVLLHTYRCLHSSYQEAMSTAAALAASDADTALLINGSLDAVVTINDQGIVTQWNQQAERIFGWSAEEMIGHRLSERVIPERLRLSHESGLADLRRHRRTLNHHQRTEVIALHRDGHEFPVELTILPLQRTDGTFYTAFIRDLTEAKRSARHDAMHRQINQLLAESQNLERTGTEILRTICESLRWDVGFLWTEVPHCHQPTLHVAALWHHPAPELAAFAQQRQRTPLTLGRDLPWRHWIHKQAGAYTDLEQGPVPEELKQLARPAQLTHAFLFPLVMQNRVHAVLAFYRRDAGAELDDLERVLTLTGGPIAQFIDRVTKTEALELSEERFALAVQGSNDGLFDWNIVTDDLYFAPRFKALLEYEDDEFPDTFNALRDHLHPEDVTRTLEAIDRHLAERHPFDQELRLRMKSGEYRWFRMRGGAIWDTGGRPLRMAGAITDISLQRQKAEALRRARDAAEAASVAKTQFLAMMSHELRTPLNPVIALADLLTRTLQNKQDREHATLILSSAKALLVLINRVLDCAKLEHGDVTIQEAPLDLRGLLHDLVKLFHAQASNKGLELRLNIEPESPIMVQGDRERLHQILSNLIGNAIKFTQAGHVQVTLRRDVAPMTLAVDVEDTGIGIDPSHHATIFQPFTQVDPSTTRSYEGTGLGLAIAHQLTTLMRGTLSIKSAVGNGATFTMHLPLPLLSTAPAEPMITHGSVLERTGTPLTQDPILVVDDQLSNCLVTQTMLSTLGYRSETVTSGKTALERFRQQRYALVLMDIQMPDLDGLEVTRQFRMIEATARLPRTPVIALTAKTLTHDHDQCLQAGLDDYLAKPCTIDDYRRMLRQWLASPPEPSCDDPVAVLTQALAQRDFGALHRTSLRLQQEAASHQQQDLALLYASLATQALQQNETHVANLLKQLSSLVSATSVSSAS